MTNLVTKETTLSLKQGEVYVKEWLPSETTSNEPLFLLHDSLGCTALWKDFPHRLATQLKKRVIAYDRLGFGHSSQLYDLPSLNFIEQEATEVFPQIKQMLGVEHYGVLGHSVGGGMACMVAANDNDCQNLITIAAQAYVEQRTLEGILSAKEFFAEQKQVERLAKWHGDKALWVLSAWIDVWTSPDFADFSLKETLPNVTCPTLVIHGESNEYGSVAFPDFIAQHVSGVVTKEVLLNCAHMPQKEQPEKVISLISDFY